MGAMAFEGRPYGLANLGNTCYLNSLLQCLNAVGLAKFLVPPVDTKAGTPHGRLYRALALTLAVLHSKGQSPVLSPQSLVEALQQNAMALGRPDFAGWMQNDVAETYTLFVDCVHEATVKKGSVVKVSVTDETKMTPIDKRCLECVTGYLSSEYSVAGKVLAGIDTAVVTGTDGTYLSAKPERFYVLTVPVPPNAASVSDCVNDYGQESDLAGENQYEMPAGFPNAGDHVDAKERRVVWLAPTVLVVETRLYRASQQRDRAGDRLLSKGYERLEASPTLDLPVWSAGRQGSVRYALCGVAYHRGGGRHGGHYTAVVRNKAGVLWNCNDTRVAALAAGAQWPAGGYCFFYRKIL